MPSRDEEQEAIETLEAILEKDKFNKLVYEPQGYLLQTVREGQSGERVTIEVGPTTEKKSQRRFLFKKVLATESTIIAYEAVRPLGIDGFSTANATFLALGSAFLLLLLAGFS